MQFSDEFLQKWEHIIDEVVKTEIPLECIKKVVFKLHNKRQRTVNLGTLKRQGLDMDQIEVALTRVLNEYGDNIRDVEWVVDAALVAEIVQPETDRLLGNLK